MSKPKRPQDACSRLRRARVAGLEHGLESAIQEAVMRHNVRYELFVDGEFARRYWGPGPHSLPAICTEENRDRWEMRCEGVVDEGTVESSRNLWVDDPVKVRDLADICEIEFADS